MRDKVNLYKLKRNLETPKSFSGIFDQFDVKIKEIWKGVKVTRRDEAGNVYKVNIEDSQDNISFGFNSNTVLLVFWKGDINYAELG